MYIAVLIVFAFFLRKIQIVCGIWFPGFPGLKCTVIIFNVFWKFPESFALIPVLKYFCYNRCFGVALNIDSVRGGCDDVTQVCTNSTNRPHEASVKGAEPDFELETIFWILLSLLDFTRAFGFYSGSFSNYSNINFSAFVFREGDSFLFIHLLFRALLAAPAALYLMKP